MSRRPDIDPERHARCMAHKQKIMNERIKAADREQGIKAQKGIER